MYLPGSRRLELSQAFFDAHLLSDGKSGGHANGSLLSAVWQAGKTAGP